MIDNQAILGYNFAVIDIKIIYEAPDYLVVEKPAGLSVHPGAGERQDTLSEWLGEYYPEIKDYNWVMPERAGIVHRLDKDTSGLIILAKNPETLEKLQGQFKSHKVHKKYLALVLGSPKEEGEISALITRDPSDRQKQKVQLVDFGLDESQKRDSLTKFRTLQRFKYKKEDLALVEAEIFTGRMHQIRVHMKYLGCPVIGDQKYSTKPSKRLSKELGINRQFLHAASLSFEDPTIGERREFSSQLPEELKDIIEKIK